MMRILQLVTALASTAAAAVITDSGSTLAARTGKVYKVKDLTGAGLTDQFGAKYTDLGIPALTPDNHLFFLFGDTFANAIGDPPPSWKAPVGLYSSSTDLNSVKIDGAVGGDTAVSLVPESHDGGTTAIPSDVFTVGDKMYMNLMRGVIYKTDHTDFWVSSDSGATWEFLYQWPQDAFNHAFQQKTCATDDNYAYCLSSIFERGTVSDLILHRVPLGSFGDIDAWEPWGFANNAWAWGNPPTTVMTSRKFGEISFRNLGNNKWVFTWLNMDPLGIHYMVLDGPTGNMFTAEEQILILPAADLASEHDNYVASPYGGFIFPGATVDSFDFAVSQWNGDTYRVMQFRADGI